jgi:hypothetical protein
VRKRPRPALDADHQRRDGVLRIMRDPAILFYTSDFLTGTTLYNHEETGKYIRALCLQHQQGHIQKNDILKIFGTEDCRVFEKFMIDSDGKYYNARMDFEIKKRLNYCLSRSENRKHGKINRIHMKHMSNICKTYVEHMENENENENELKKERKKRLVPAIPSLDECKQYFRENGYPESLAIEFWNYYQAGNPPWYDQKGNPVRSWRQKARAVWFKPEKKDQIKKVVI